MLGQMLLTQSRSVCYKDPDEVRDVNVDWRSDLPAGVTVAASTFLPSDPTLVVDSDTFTGEGTVARLSGGTVNTRVPVTNRVTLSDGQVYDYTFTIVVKER